jgi:hypothetical protein
MKIRGFVSFLAICSSYLFQLLCRGLTILLNSLQTDMRTWLELSKLWNEFLRYNSAMTRDEIIIKFLYYVRIHHYRPWVDLLYYGTHIKG